jgi:hypothetical protein
MTTTPQQDEKSTVLADPAALELLVVLQEAPGVPVWVRVLPGFRRLVGALQAWVISVERRVERQEVKR